MGTLFSPPKCLQMAKKMVKCSLITAYTRKGACIMKPRPDRHTLFVRIVAGVLALLMLGAALSALLLR